MDILIYGCGGHARSVADVILDNDKRTKIEFFDWQAEDGELILKLSSGGGMKPISAQT